MARYRTSGPNRWFTLDGTEYYPDDTGWITPPNAAVESAMINAGLIADCVPQINPAGQIIDPRTQSPVSGGGGSISVPQITSMSSMPGLVYWLDAAKPLFKTGYVRCVADGDTVDIVPDASGGGVFATVSATKPVFKPAALNGLPAIALNGGTFTLPGFMTSALGANCTIVGYFKSTVSHSDLRLFFSTATPNMWVGANGTNNGTLSTNLLNIVAIGATPAPISVNGISEDGIVGFVISPTVLKAEVDRVFIAGSVGNASSQSVTPTGPIAYTGQDLMIGGKGSAFLFPGLLGEFAIFNRALSVDEYQQVTDYLAKKWIGVAKPLLVCDGNSWTSGVGSSGGSGQALSATGTNLPSLLLSAFSGRVEVRTDAVPSRDFGTASIGLLAGAPFFTDAFCRRTSTERRVAHVWEITNTLVTTKSAGATYDLLVKFCLERKAAGFAVVVATCLPRVANPYGGFDADRVAVNALVVANYKSFASGLVDFASDARLNDASNLTYYSNDGIHPNDAGYAVCKELAYPVVAALLDGV